MALLGHLAAQVDAAEGPLVALDEAVAVDGVSYGFLEGKAGSAAMRCIRSLSKPSCFMRVAAAWEFSLDQSVVERDFPNRAGDFAFSSVTLDRLPVEE